ncbi:MAG: hypothetical protein ACREID_06955 [Planctomycetota bacterium]
MTAQQWAAYLLVGAAAAYLVARWAARRRAATCCGERECPAAKGMMKKIRRVSGSK